MPGMIQVYAGRGPGGGPVYVTRPGPAAPAQAYKTYGMSMPLKTHWRPATCEEVACEAYLNGWASTFDLSTKLGQKQYYFCTHDDERSPAEERVGDSLVRLTYQPGTPCFRRSEHKARLDRPSRFYVAGGDFRGNPLRTPVRVHDRPEHWVEDFSAHADKIRTALERGLCRARSSSSASETTTGHSPEPFWPTESAGSASFSPAATGKRPTPITCGRSTSSCSTGSRLRITTPCSSGKTADAPFAVPRSLAAGAASTSITTIRPASYAACYATAAT